ncbi:endosome-associated-trafficking regulator 1 isoform X2 [Passer montanus]|uniref:endosome-associated-trafficking regulator 1 isoform X2 n=1 Tax=Passer montanus TaxID=9160 RepID=UPI001960E5AB|nr:endosome-associated-trafficking regulator 1 isoform X2 [Passer montanus]
MAAAILPPPGARGQGAGPRLRAAPRLGAAAESARSLVRCEREAPPRAALRRPWRRRRCSRCRGLRPSPTPSPSASSSAPSAAAGTRSPLSPPQAGPAVPPLPAVPAGSGDEQEDEDEEWSDSYQPLAVEQAHLGSAGAAAGPGRAPSYEQLKEENAVLRSKINKLQILAETQADKMRKLEKKLEENKIKEEKEAQDLEAMVQHVEQNLQLMTKRAAKAENSAAKLRQENAQLQAAAVWGRIPAARGRSPELHRQNLRGGRAGAVSASRSTQDFVFIRKPLLKSEFFILGLILTRQTAHLALHP